ncbi:Putative uncharacterized protein [Taphrina deformans PYCC 5710]|uniref:Lariat debranching enzyme C-terminal domain-containing protein n=1 Tax=Taphrina deformans (strain PYCC 5710 / ATCC 11124 / CBS 356.35 / IMI 108563 / JCM 9778 / NBRC 8474) TaxID=1097556 RepID=R4XCQ0_TAPDE|nr:Putative uncharacterized protein [Taphrina deformans PYCC 5710]|eukprot:CCG82161.1 Putative uncharacterized protein [Taphrina deformans PYCC 5710]
MSTGIHAYRNIIRSAGIAFKGDTATLLAARMEIRRNFEASRELTDSEQVTKVQHAQEIAKVLRQNVVQGRLDETKEDTYDLRIHKDIELGDNETIRQKKSQAAAAGQSESDKLPAVSMSRPLRVAVQGCCHGELNTVYAAIAAAEIAHDYKVDLLIVGGDFQSVRNLADLSCMAVPAKFRRLGDFADYYARKKVAPVLTIFVGGNHEASNYLQELFYGGWVAPNIYYLGAANVINYGGLRIGGISGIWSKYDYVRGHMEKTPYDKNSLRSVYHVRQFEVKKLLRMSAENDRCDIFLSHDWPRGIEQYGDTQKLLKAKPFFREEVARNDLGSPANEELLNNLKPRFWFCAHLHVRFEATVDHAQTGDKRTRQTSRPFVSQQRKINITEAPPKTGIGANPDEIVLDIDEGNGNPDEICLELDEEDEKEETTSVTRDTVHALEDTPNDIPVRVAQSYGTDNMSLEEYKQQVLRRNGLSKDAHIKNQTSRENTNHTLFLALDKCLPRRQFLEIMTIPIADEGSSTTEPDLRLRYDAQWLAITKAFSPYISKTAYQKTLPNDSTLEEQLTASRNWVSGNVHNLLVPLNFEQTAPVQSAEITERSRCKISPLYAGILELLMRIAEVYINPQTTAFCHLLGLSVS